MQCTGDAAMTHPIKPSLMLIDLWWEEARQNAKYDELIGPIVATKAAQWGADQELEACCEWLDKRQLAASPEYFAKDLRAARRPKPPSLKEQALEALNQADEGLNESEWQQRSNTIRRALEALPND